MLQRLKRSQWLSKLHALLGVVHGGVECSLCRAQRLGATQCHRQRPVRLQRVGGRLPLQQDVVSLEHEIESTVHAAASVMSRKALTLDAVGRGWYQHPGLTVFALRQHRQMSG